MASGYALPTPGGSYHGHSHSYSYSNVHLSPGKTTTNSFPKSNGSVVKKAVSNSALYTHAEISRETSPISFPDGDHIHTHHNHMPSVEQNLQAYEENAGLSNHTHTHSSSSMKSRPRGESDLGRPADIKNSAHRPTLNIIHAASTPWFSIPEILTSLLISLPYVLASAAFSSTTGLLADNFPPLSAYRTASMIGSEDTVKIGRHLALVNAAFLTSGTLIVVGILAKISSTNRGSEKGKHSPRSSVDVKGQMTLSSFQTMALHVLCIGLPFYASMHLGGTRTGIILLVAVAANLTCTDIASGSLFEQWKHLWSSKVATSVVILLCFIADEAGITIQTSLTELMLGYLALAVSVLVLPPPFPITRGALRSRPSSRASNTVSGSALWSRSRSNSNTMSVASPLTQSLADLDTTLIAGVILLLLTVFTTTLFSTAPKPSTSSFLLMIITIASMASAVLFSQPSSLRSQSKAGLGLGCLVTASCSFLFSPSLWPGTVCNGGLSALAFLGALYDTQGSLIPGNTHDHHDHGRNAHIHQHNHQHSNEGSSSAFTKLIMARCEPGSLIYSVLSEKDSRRIAYFTILNFGFMIVQGIYGYISGSLGLLSDTVHMFFDCLGLIVGLGAAVASKWPTSPEKPYGWGKLNTLAGFGNGIFLMLVSVEFVWEAIEGIVEGTELRHVQELLVVSTLGLLVNMVGLFAFGHAHHGHDHGHSHSHGLDHGHSHSHGHNHSRSHSHGHSHDHDHNVANGHAHSHDCNHSHEHEHKAPQSHGHDHHHNENMHGIFLHVAADAGGSLAVIISTALTLWKPWYLWDPLATIMIAVLIFAAAVPLVTSSGQKLLLVIPDEHEYNIKNTLQELGELRGVVGYAVPRFWIDDRDEDDDTHSHNHHGHDHAPSKGKKKVLGVIHVIAAPSADLDDVRQRVEEFVADRNMNLVIQVEREAEGQCWCGGGALHSG